jgi:hypothetical protein
VHPNQERVLVVEPYRRLSGVERSEVADEGVRLLGFLDGVAAGGDVRFLPE